MPRNSTLRASAALKTTALSAADALRKVLADQSDPDSWVELGNALPSGVSAEVESGSYFDSCACFFEALRISERQNALAWIGLGASLSKTMNGQFPDGEEVSQQQCFERAVELDPTNVAAWLHLGASLGKNDVAIIDERKFTATECLKKASLLKAELEVMGGGTDAPYHYYSTPQSSSETPRARNNNNNTNSKKNNRNENDDEQEREHHDADGDELKEIVKAPPKNKQQLAEEAIEEELNAEEKRLRGVPEHPAIFWLQLAEALTSSSTTSNPSSYQHQQQQPIVPPNKNDFDASSAALTPSNNNNNNNSKQGNNNNSSWFSSPDDYFLQISSTFFGGRQITRLMCYEKAVEADARNSNMWLALESALADEERKQEKAQEIQLAAAASIDDDEFGLKKKKKNTTNSDDADSNYSGESSEHDDDENDAANATTQNKNNNNASPTASKTPTTDAVVCHVFGENLSRRRCILRAIDCDKSNSEAWLRLATEHLLLDDMIEEEIFAPDEHNQITLLDGETKVSHRMAAEKAALLAPNNSNAWVMVAACLSKARNTSSYFYVPQDLIRNYNEKHKKNSQRVPLLQQGTYTALQCLERAVSLDPCNVRAWIALAKLLTLLSSSNNHEITAAVLGQQIVASSSSASSAVSALANAGTKLRNLFHHQNNNNNNNKKNDHHDDDDDDDHDEESVLSALAKKQAQKQQKAHNTNNNKNTNETHSRQESKVNAKFCLEKALSLNPKLSSIWKRLALMLTAEYEDKQNKTDKNYKNLHQLLKQTSTFSSSASSSSTKKQLVETLRKRIPNLSISSSNSKQQQEPFATVRGDKITLKKCLFKCVETDPQNSEGWLTLGTFLAGLEGNAGKNNSSNNDNNNNNNNNNHHQNPISTIIRIDENVIKGVNADRPIDAVYCFIRTVELDPFSVEGWSYLGACMTNEFVDVDDDVYSRQDCFEQARLVDLRGAEGWIQKGLAAEEEERAERRRLFELEREKIIKETTPAGLPAQFRPKCLSTSSSSVLSKIGKRALTRDEQDDLLGATKNKNLVLDPRQASSKNSQQQQQQAQQQQQLAHHAHPAFTSTTNSNLIKVRTIQECQEEQIICYHRAVTLDPTDFRCWAHLGTVLPTGRKIKILENFYNNVDCLTKAVHMSPEHPRVWFFLGKILSFGERVIFEEEKQKDVGATIIKKLERYECFQRGVTLDPQDAEIWMYLGIELLPKQKVIVNETKYSKKNCFEKAVTIDSTLTLAWTHLSVTNEEEEQENNDDNNGSSKKKKILPIVVNGSKISSMECFFNGLAPIQRIPHDEDF